MTGPTPPAPPNWHRGWRNAIVSCHERQAVLDWLKNGHMGRGGNLVNPRQLQLVDWVHLTDDMEGLDVIGHQHTLGGRGCGLTATFAVPLEGGVQWRSACTVPSAVVHRIPVGGGLVSTLCSSTRTSPPWPGPS